MPFLRRNRRKMMISAVFVALTVLGHAQGSSFTGTCAERLQTLETIVNDIKEEIIHGAVYTRWGRLTCPTGSELIYEGLAAGSWFSVAGGGANYLCLPRDPEWTRVPRLTNSCGSYIYGSEYQTCSADIFSTKNTRANSLEHQDVPCAVCQTISRPQHLMVPAKMRCPTGWTEDYSGYLMASHASHRRTEYVCVDSAPETLARGQRDENGALFYPVRAKCGTLPCPPFTDNEEMPCAVCSR